MAICVEEPIPPCDETYWRDDNAAPPILLIDEATQVITEAIHRFHSIPLLDYRDLAAAGVTLGDLFGALNLLTDLLGIPIRQRADTDALEARKLDDELQTLGALMRLAQQAAEGLWLEARKSFPPATQTAQSGNLSVDEGHNPPSTSEIEYGDSSGGLAKSSLPLDITGEPRGDSGLCHHVARPEAATPTDVAATPVFAAAWCRSVGATWTLELREVNNATGLGPIVHWISSGGRCCVDGMREWQACVGL